MTINTNDRTQSRWLTFTGVLTLVICGLAPLTGCGKSDAARMEEFLSSSVGLAAVCGAVALQAFGALWITRLSAAAEANGMLYSRFINGCKKAGIELNRKELSELAIHDPEVFTQICDQAKAAIA